MLWPCGFGSRQRLWVLFEDFEAEYEAESGPIIGQ